MLHQRSQSHHTLGRYDAADSASSASSASSSLQDHSESRIPRLPTNNTYSNSPSSHPESLEGRNSSQGSYNESPPAHFRMDFGSSDKQRTNRTEYGLNRLPDSGQPFDGRFSDGRPVVPAKPVIKSRSHDLLSHTG